MKRSLKFVFAILWLVVTNAIAMESIHYQQARQAFKERRYDDAVRLFELASKTDELSIYAQFFIGRHYFVGVSADRVDLKKSRFWLRKPADEGYAWAQYYLGKVLEDPDEKIKYFEKAINQGFIEAGMDLEDLYRQRQPSSGNFFKACLYERVAASDWYGLRAAREPTHCSDRLNQEDQEKLKSEMKRIVALRDKFKDFD